MAEIKIERKKNPVWPWIIILLVIAAAAAAWFLMSNNDNKTIQDDEEREYQDTVSLDETYFFRDSSSQFIQYVNDSLDENRLTADYVKRGFFLLAEDLEKIIARENIQDLPIRAKLDSVRVNTTRIEKDDPPQIGPAALSSLDLMINLQTQKYPALAGESLKLRYASERIRKDENRNTNDKDVKIFFKRAAILLDKMNTRTADF